MFSLSLFLLSLESVFHRASFKILMKSDHFVVVMLLESYLRFLSPVQGHRAFLLSFLLNVLQFHILYLES